MNYQLLLEISLIVPRIPLNSYSHTVTVRETERESVNNLNY